MQSQCYSHVNDMRFGVHQSINILMTQFKMIETGYMTHKCVNIFFLMISGVLINRFSILSSFFVCFKLNNLLLCLNASLQLNFVLYSSIWILDDLRPNCAEWMWT